MKIAVDPLFLEPRARTPSHAADMFSYLVEGAKYDNVGNYFIADALSEILNFDEAVVYSTHFQSKSSQDVIDYINNNCSHYVMRGATMLVDGRIDRWCPYEKLSKIKIPIYWIGLANESAYGHSVSLKKSEIKSLKYICESGGGIAVRGENTLKVLSAHGISQNVEVLGCPTIYWNLKPKNRIQEPTWENVVWTWREHLYSGGQEKKLQRTQFRLVEDCMGKADGKVALAVQDMSEKHWISQYFGKYAHATSKFYTVDRNEVFPVIKKVDNTKIPFPDYKGVDKSLINQMKSKLFFSLDINDYRQKAIHSSITLGMRLHGNIIALSQGKPAYFYTYDQRIQEIVDLLELPSQKLVENSTLPELDSLDYGPYERNYADLYQSFKSFIEKSGLKTNLV